MARRASTTPPMSRTARPPTAADHPALQRAQEACERGEFEEAIGHYRVALRRYPRSPELHNDLANACRSIWRMDDAIRHYRRAVEIQPNFAMAHHNLGVTLLDAGKAADAAEALEEALRLRRGREATIHSLMLARTREGRPDLALPWLHHFQQHADERPHDAGAQVDLALALTKFERMADAAACIRRAMELGGESTELLKFLGLILQELGEYESALESFERALVREPESGELHFYRSIELLRQGRLAEGFREYEWRWRHAGFPSPRAEFAQPLWDGGDFGGRVLLLHTEQGLGDAIQFVRYAELAKARGGRVVVLCEAPLARLFEGCAGVDEIAVKGGPLPHFDLHAPLLSLPHLLGTELHTIPARRGYLAPPAALRALPPRRAGTRLRVGIAWAGSPGHGKDRLRSCGLAALEPLLRRDDLDLVSLQHGPAAAELRSHPLGHRVHDLGSGFRDLGEAAEAMMQLDLVICVDTSVAHLAAAMGRETWMLTPFDADWRWLLGRADSPWYPTLRLFRQERSGDWAAVVGRICAELPAVAPATVETRVPETAEPARARFAEAVRLHTAGEEDAAEAAYRAVLELDPAFPEAHNNLGVLLRRHDDLEGSLREFRAAVASRADYPEAQINLGLALGHAGDAAGARACFEAVVARHPDHAVALLNLGAALNQAKEAERAVEVLRAADRAQPDRPEVLSNLGNALLLCGRSDEAIALYRRAIELNPGYADALNNLGAALRAKREYAQAIPLFLRALEIRPDYLDALENLALAAPAADEFPGREAVLRAAAERNAGDPRYAAALAGALQESARFEEAELVARQVLERDERTLGAWVTLGICRMESGDAEEATYCYRRALALDPTNAVARWNLSLSLLMRGEYSEGWEEYESRWGLMYFLPERRPFDAPLWDGSASLDGRTLLLFTEQGFGDGIQFIRFARDLKERHRVRVVLEAPEGLVQLFRECPWVDQVVRRGDALPPFDCYLPLLSLPRLLGVTLESLSGAPYLRVGRRRIQERIRRSGRLRVGLTWAGRAPNANLARRSLRLDSLRPLLDLPDVDFYSLQKGDAAREIAACGLADRIVDLEAELHDFVDTAAAIQELDLVISIDTAVAHLAAAIGTPTWVLLMQVPDWRWMRERPDSPWYQAATLFRQVQLGEWEPVVAEAAAALRERVRTRRVDTASGEGEDRIPLDSAERSPDGSPRFRIELPLAQLADPRAFACYQRELLGERADAEVRSFLDGQLVDGDVLVDVGAGWGLASLSAAARPERAVRVFSVVGEPAEAELLRSNAAANRLGSALQVTVSPCLGEAPVDAMLPEGEGNVYVRIADAADVVPLLPRLGGVISSGRLAGVIWPSGGAGAAGLSASDIVADGLSAFHFEHFNVDHDDEGAVLVPHRPHAAGETIVVSLSRAVLAEATDAGTATAAFPERSHPLSIAPCELGLDWQVASASGWGVYGLNLVTHALRSGSQPLLLAEPDGSGLSPLHRAALEPALRASAALHGRMRRGEDVTIDGPVLRALGNGLAGGSRTGSVRGSAEVGVVFFEDTALDAAALARGRRFDRIVAGSTWNADVLRARGLDRVDVCLQGVDPAVFHPAPSTGLLGDRFIVFSGGKLEYRKGQDLVVAAFRRFRERHPDALLMVAWHNHWPRTMAEITTRGHVRGTPAPGEGGRPDVRAWLASNGVPADSVIDLGLTSHASMGPLIREAHLAVFPNRCEGGTNLVAMECLASGVPTALSANTGHLDLLQRVPCYALREQGPCLPTAQFAGTDGWGESSVEEIVATMERAYTDSADARARGEAASAAMQELSWSAQIGRLLAILRSVD